MLRLQPRADLAVMYAADMQRYLGTDIARVVTLERFLGFYEGCPSIGFERDGRSIGGIVFDGVEAHIAVLPAHHGRWALLLKPALDWLFSLQPEILVAIDRDNERCLRFLRRHGWQCVDDSAEELVFRLVPQAGTRKTAYPFQRRSTEAAGLCHRSTQPEGAFS